jgi:transcriptional regulator with XRE-family HTH domain
MQRDPSKGECYAHRVKPEQRAIASWLERTRVAANMTWAQLARAAKLGAATTLTRAVQDDYDSVTKIETLHAVATAAGVPSVLDYFAGTLTPAEDAAEPMADETAVSSEELEPILSELLRRAPSGGWSESEAPRLAAMIEYGLQLAKGDHANLPTEDGLRVAARAAAARFPEGRH